MLAYLGARADYYHYKEETELKTFHIHLLFLPGTLDCCAIGMFAVLYSEYCSECTTAKDFFKKFLNV